MNAPSLKIQHYFFLFVFLVSAWLMFSICRPFLNSLVIAGCFAIVFYPVFRFINKYLNNRRSLASILTILVIIILVFTPLIIIGSLLFGEVGGLYFSIATRSGTAGGIYQFITILENKVRIFVPEISFDITFYVEQALRWVFLNLDKFFSSFVGILLNGFVMVVSLFFLLRDGKKLRDELLVISPLEQKYDENIFNKVISAVNAVVKGSLMISVIQGFFAGVGFAIAGVPNPVIWGVATMLASLIPGFGTALVTVPCIIFLFLTAPLWQAITLTVWAFAGVGFIDNLISPFILNRGMKIHPFLVLLSVLGGISFFGPVGFVIGPIILALFFALLEIYPLIIKTEQ